MSAKLWETGTSNAFSTTLNGSISASDTSITLTTATGLVAPGVICIDRVDALNTATPTKREYVSFTGISTNTLTGCTRGVAGSTAQSHNSGATVEENWSTTHWGDAIDFLQVSHDSSGNIVATSTATLTTVRLYTHLNASGASITGRFPLNPGWVIGGLVSLATTSVGKPFPMPQEGLFSFWTLTLRAPASGSALIVDINKNGSSIFDSGTRPTIAAGGTFVSTASIAIRSFNAGDIFSADIDQGGGLGQDLTILGRAL